MGRKWFQRSSRGAIRDLGVRRPNHRDRSRVGQLSALHSPHREEIIPISGSSLTKFPILSLSPQKPDSQEG